MKMHTLALALLTVVGAVATFGANNAAAADVGISVQIGEPGFYGRLDIGRFPAPEVVYSRPVVIERIPYGVSRPPIYLRVPPGHQKNWRKYCGRYHACGEPVFFVRENWYRNDYAPRYKEYRHEHGEGWHDDDHGRGRDHDDDRGHGKGNGNGHGHGHDDRR